MIHPKFKANVENGSLKVDDMIGFTDYLRTLPKRVDVIVKPWSERNQRSTPQNRYYWKVVVRVLAEDIGYTDDEMHEILKTRFLSRGLNVKGTLVYVGKSTTKLDTKEFEDYVEKIRRWAAKDLGINVPEPDEIE